jgi:membrane fusion protein (multidrug efflux system)
VSKGRNVPCETIGQAADDGRDCARFECNGAGAAGTERAARRRRDRGHNAPIVETSEFLGRVEATNRVDIVARVTAFMDKRVFNEGAEVKTGDLLYQLERGPFEADLATKQAQVAQLQATLENAKLTTERARTLLAGPAGLQSTYDAAIANQRSLEAQVVAAQAQVKFSQINLDYTEIRSPIDGMIGRTAVTDGKQARQMALS